MKKKMKMCELCIIVLLVVLAIEFSIIVIATLDAEISLLLIFSTIIVGGLLIFILDSRHPKVEKIENYLSN